MQTLTPEEKQNSIIALDNLKQAIENTLAAVTKEKPSKNLAQKWRACSLIDQ